MYNLLIKLTYMHAPHDSEIGTKLTAESDLTSREHMRTCTHCCFVAVPGRTEVKQSNQWFRCYNDRLTHFWEYFITNCNMKVCGKQSGLTLQALHLHLILALSWSSVLWCSYVVIKYTFSLQALQFSIFSPFHKSWNFPYLRTAIKLWLYSDNFRVQWFTDQK
jgi:hypothetical protein